MRAGSGALAACLLVATSCVAAQSHTSNPSSPQAASQVRETPVEPSYATPARTVPPPITASDARTVPVTALPGLSCSLPVYMDGSVPPAGFVRFPSGRLAMDPTGAFKAAGTGNVIVSVAKPVLDGTYGALAYDWQQHRWVPTAPQMISPDGSAYAYPQEYGAGGAMYANRLRVVTVATGNDRLLYTGAFADAPIAWTSAGIYDVAVGFEVSSTGLWLIDPATGSARAIIKSGGWDVISGGAAWGFGGVIYANGPPDPYPHTVDRLDLTTGKVTNWFTAPYPHNVHVAGLDTAGRPVIVVDHYHVYRLVGPSQAVAMFNSPVMLWDGTRMQLDSHGLWFSTIAGIEEREANGPGYTPLVSDVWLYSYATGLRKVAEFTSYTDEIFSIAGPCR
jgi:hypothetical protein